MNILLQVSYRFFRFSFVCVDGFMKFIVVLPICTFTTSKICMLCINHLCMNTL
nr:MAG TPA: hypothetical protein [Caudoviricetes sp.]